MDPRIFHHIFAFLGTVCFTWICILMLQKGCLSLSLGELTALLAAFWVGNLLFTACFFVPIDEEFKNYYLVLFHMSWGQLGLLVLAYFSTPLIEVSMMMSLATFVFIVFGMSSIKLFPVVLAVVVGFGGILLTEEYERAEGESLIIFLAYTMSVIFIAAINAFAGNLQLFLTDQNRVIKNKTEELAKTQLELLRAKEEAEQSSRSKTRFLAAASHDLRQPLHALELYIANLSSDTRKEDMEHILRQMGKSAYELRELLNCLFDISRYDADMAKVNLRSFTISQIIEDLDIEFKGLSIQEKRPLKIRYSDALVESDPVLLHRIIRGLVNNALKHAQKGRVLVGFRPAGENIRCEVWDSGVGISEEDQPKIFEEFYQVQNAHRDREQGLGLGLALIKRMCDVLGHDMGMRSEPGKGSVFWFEIKRSMQTADPVWEQSNSVSSNESNSACVLCIDDERVILDGMSMLISQWGYEVITATSPYEAIEKLKSASKVPDIFLCDYRLADGINGLEAISMVNRFLNEEVPSVLITGDMAEEISQEAESLGHKVLLKPLNPAFLRVYIQNSLRYA